MMSTYFYDIRDSLVEDGSVFDAVSKHVGETVRLAFNLPYDTPFSETSLVDSFTAKNVHDMDKELDTFASKIIEKIKIDDMKIDDEHRFLVHKGVTVRSEEDDLHATNVYTPFTLMFNDRQVLTALVKNVVEKGKLQRAFSMAKPVEVERWAINNKDVTKFVYPDGKRDVSNAVVAKRLATMLEKLHPRFSKKNGKTVSQTLKDKIVKFEFAPTYPVALKTDIPQSVPKVTASPENDENEFKTLKRLTEDLISKYESIPIEDRKADTDTLHDLLGSIVGEKWNEYRDGYIPTLERMLESGEANEDIATELIQFINKKISTFTVEAYR
jgi:hypothetical protein